MENLRHGWHDRQKGQRDVNRKAGRVPRLVRQEMEKGVYTMQMQEFVELTGFDPTQEEYISIEEEYMSSGIDKRDFCQRFVERGEPARLYKRRGKRIEELGRKLTQMEKEHEAGVAQLLARVAQLKEELDRELGWKPAENVGTNMSQEEYEELVKCGEELNIVKATEIVCREFGFDRCRVVVNGEAVTYEVNKYGCLRVKDELMRPPVYSSTDWNYIRFDCAGIMYEMVNGGLERYEE